MSASPDADALFIADGDRFIPTGHTRGPWDPQAQHGGPVAALIARAVEAEPAPEPLEVARLTIELLRPVPVEPLSVLCRVSRSGRRVQLVETQVRAGELEICRAVALRIRHLEGGPVPIVAAPDDPPVLDPDASRPGDNADEGDGTLAFHRTGVEMRYARGSFVEPGPATVWIRLRRPVVDGETPSALMRVAGAADFGNGVSAVLDWATSLFINPDLTISLHRPCRGEWVCLDSTTRIGAGVGLAESALSDTQGPIGRSLQSLYVDRR